MPVSRDSRSPVIVWFRQDLRLADNPALAEAVASERPVIPLFVLHRAADGRPWGAASKWWLDKSLRSLDLELRLRGSRLILRRGDPALVVSALAHELGADVVWNRLYGPAAVVRDGELKAELKASSHNASLLVEPHAVRTGAGEPYRVFTPFWRAARAQVGEGRPLSAPNVLFAPQAWPWSDAIEDWRLHPRAPDWSAGFGDWKPGEAGGLKQLHALAWLRLSGYAETRDRPDMEATSQLSPHLHWGEVGPRQAFGAVLDAVGSGLATPAEADKFLAELGLREFNHHLLYHFGHIARRNLRPEFDHFPWRDDEASLEAWKQGSTGYPLVDAGMRQLWATGFMHNRVRMVVASFLVKHLLIDWREGEAWFWDTLVDACAANNPANWQWSAGSGADAQPFFRIFNPVSQGERFDPNGDYVRRWVPELRDLPAELIHKPWEAGGAKGYPRPIVDHALARARALEAFKAMRAEASTA
ncbi:MAG: cryptochrome/photolyase family protein [Caulobacteraceae bacterium]